MSGRRSHLRYDVIQSPEGLFRVMRDVLVEYADQNEVVAVSREPGVLGETVKVEISAQEPRARVAARVVDSQPVVENGTVRHRLRLETMGAEL